MTGSESGSSVARRLPLKNITERQSLGAAGKDDVPQHRKLVRFGRPGIYGKRHAAPIE